MMQVSSAFDRIPEGITAEGRRVIPMQPAGVHDDDDDVKGEGHLSSSSSCKETFAPSGGTKTTAEHDKCEQQRVQRY